MTTEETLKGPLKFLFILLVLPLLLLLVPVVVVWMLCKFLVRLTVLVLVWLTWSTRGISMLVVYSNSPHWQDYFEKGLLPLVGHRSNVLNWSDHLTWPITFKRIVFALFGGERDFNPIIIFFLPLRWPTTLRFHQPFRDAKHGKTKPLQKLEDELSFLINQEFTLEHLYPRSSA